MPEVQEVFRMATQKVRPDPGFADRQYDHRRKRERNRKIGALGLVAAIGVAAAVFAIRLAGEEDRSQPAVQPTPTPPGSEVLAPDVPYTIDLDTGEMTPLAESLGGEIYHYPVSPDGTMLAYNRYTDSSRLYVANVDGTGEREVTPGGEDAFTGSWSPDGSLLVYQGRGRAPELGNLFVVDVTTEEIRQITDLEPRTAYWWYLSPIFSPDGKTILFQLPSSDAKTRWDLWSVPVAGGEPTLVRSDASMGAFAPDGETLAYLDAPRGNGGGGWSSSLWLADADGSDPRLLVDGDGDFLRWSPDGTRIAYAGDGEIHVVDVATGETSHVIEGGTAEWLDDDTLVVSKFILTG